MNVIAHIAFGIVVLNGLRVTLGIRPVRYYMRHGRECEACGGTGEIYPTRPQSAASAASSGGTENT